VLYGLEMAAAQEGPVVIVEGILDAWKVGPSSVALLGKTLSLEQIKLLHTHLRQRDLIVWLDSDATAEAERLVQRVRQERKRAGDSGHVLLASCPEGRKDPGECTSVEVSELIALKLQP